MEAVWKSGFLHTKALVSVKHSQHRTKVTIEDQLKVPYVLSIGATINDLV